MGGKVLSSVVKGIKGEKSKEQLIKSAAHLFFQKGYNATGLNEIINQAELTKGSFYFYFTSKKDLAMAVAEYYDRLKINDISKAAAGSTWEEFVDKLVADSMEEVRQQRNFGCPLAVLGMEIAFSEPDVVEQYYTSLKRLTAIFADVLKRTGISNEQADILADRALSLFEGYSLFYRLSKDVTELEKISTNLKMITAT